ncbi:MAG: acyltransferase [Alphaproteobacteria bacterium]|nr:acyltransferase [Alphaproteobacteria bacterium]
MTENIQQSLSPPAPKSVRGGFNGAAHGLRGIAAMMVFCAHLLGGTAEHIYQGHAHYVAFVVRPWQFGVYGVELFFTISGFVILPSILRYSAGQFALRRLLRLYPLFFVLTLFFVLSNTVTHEYPDVNNWRTIIGGFTFTNLLLHTEQLTPNAWSLTYEVMFYILTCLGVTFLVKQRRWMVGGLVLLLSVLFLVRYPIATYFLFGLGIRVLHDRGVSLRRELAWPLEFVAALSCIYFASSGWFTYKPADVTNPILIATMLSTAAYFFLAISPGSLTGRLLAGPATTYLGTVSYSLYLVHPYTYYVMRLLFVKLGLFTDHIALSMLLFFLVTTPVTLLLTHVIHHLIELGPYEWFFRQRVYRVREAERGQSSKAGSRQVSGGRTA